jgi:hypothetical protein
MGMLWPPPKYTNEAFDPDLRKNPRPNQAKFETYLLAFFSV